MALMFPKGANGITVFESPKLLRAARGMCCMNCGSDDDTVVSAHGNWLDMGKGKGIKNPDYLVAWLCFRCHAWLDQAGNEPDPTGLYLPTKEDKREMWTRAYFKTVAAWFHRGIVVVA